MKRIVFMFATCAGMLLMLVGLEFKWPRVALAGQLAILACVGVWTSGVLA